MLKKVSNIILHKILFKIQEYNKPDLSEGKHLLCPNHTSDFDGPIFWAAFQELRIMAKKECFKNPLIKNILTKANVVPVDRFNNPTAAIKSTINYLQEPGDKTFLMFPQGTISDINKNQLSRIKPGAFFISDLTNTPIIPVFIEQPRLFRKSRIIYGNEINVENNDNNNDKYSLYRKLWQEEIFKLEEDATKLEDRQVRTLKLNKKHRNNNS